MEDKVRTIATVDAYGMFFRHSSDVIYVLRCHAVGAYSVAYGVAI